MAATEFPAIAFAVDDNYCLPLLVAWQSLRETNPGLAREVPVVVLHEGLSAGSAARIEFHARRLGLDASLRPARLPDLPYNVAFGGARANYLRLAIPDALTGHDRVLYLDADLVIRDDLGPLLRADLRGMPIGAVRDPVNPTYESGQALPGWQALGIPGHREYFNSGVLVIDQPAATRADLFGRALDMVAKHPQMLRLWDQDALNVAAGDRWHRLPGRWNSVPFSALVRTPWIRYKAASVTPLADLIAAEDDAAITHYVSPAKPWKGLLPRGAANDLYQRQATAVLAAEDALGPATLH